MTNSNKLILIELVKGFISTLIMGFGVALFIKSELGSDPVSVFLDGFNRTTCISISMTDWAINIILFIIALIINRDKVGLNTVINVLILGICIEIPTELIGKLNISSQSYLIRIIAMIIGQICLTGSFAYMQTFKYGISAMDAVIFKIRDVTNFKYRSIKMAYDLLFIVVGYILGGIVGIGTIFSLATNGILTEFEKKLIDKYITKEITQDG